MASFSLFRVNEKRSENSPDYSGGVEVLEQDVAELIEHLKSGAREEDYQGRSVVKLRIAAWLKESKGGKKYMGGSISVPQELQAAPTPVTAPLPEDMPF